MPGVGSNIRITRNWYKPVINKPRLLKESEMDSVRLSQQIVVEKGVRPYVWSKTNDLVMWPLGQKRGILTFARLIQYKGVKYCDVRQFFVNKNGFLSPTLRGTRLPVEDLEILDDAEFAIEEAIKRRTPDDADSSS